MYKLILDSRRSWKSAADVITAICNETCDVSYDSRRIGDIRIATVEIRLDDPQTLTEDRENDPEIIFSGGYADIIYRAFEEMKKVIRDFEIPLEFAWSSIPLAPLSDDKKLQAERENVMYKNGAVHTLWVRGDDNSIINALKNMEGHGLVQVQNMATANTWIRDGLNDEAIIASVRR